MLERKKDLIRFSCKGEEVTFNTSFMKKLMNGSRKDAMRWMIEVINNQSYLSSEAEKFNKEIIDTSYPRYWYASIDEEFSGEPIVPTPDLAPDFKKWLEEEDGDS